MVPKISLSAYPFSFYAIIFLAQSKSLQSCGFQGCHIPAFFIICLNLTRNLQVCLLHWISKTVCPRIIVESHSQVKRFSDAVILKDLLSGYHFTLYIRISFDKLSLILWFLKMYLHFLTRFQDPSRNFQVWLILQFSRIC